MIKVLTSDSQIWNRDEVISALSSGEKIIDLNNEGPDYGTLDLIYEVDKIYTCNLIEKNPKAIKQAPYHLIQHTLDIKFRVNKNIIKHFGLFIGRGNPLRNWVGSYVYNNYKDITIHTNHFNKENEFYASNIGLDKLMTLYNMDPTPVAKYLLECPINCKSTNINKTINENPAQQLLNNDAEIFLNYYNNFFVEIVCETYYTGDTFFPTEKIWRPILLETPFIVQGPANFLKNLKRLGFKTFDRWWNEGYDDLTDELQIHEIFNLLDTISKLDVTKIYNEMKPILKHNKELLLSLTKKDFEIFL